jgi:hypothetical protein
MNESARREGDMTYPQAIFGGLALLAAAFAFGTGGQPRADSTGFDGVATLRTAGQSGDTIWRINKQNGAVSLCFAPNTREMPACSPWSKP